MWSRRTTTLALLAAAALASPSRGQCNQAVLPGPVLAGANHGSAVAAADFVIAVGSPGFSNSRGKVSVERDVGGVWLTQLVTTPGSVLPQGRFGESVALNEDGTVLVVGAPNAQGFSNGVAYIFEYDPGPQKWGLAKAVGVPGVTNDRMGTAVAASGDVVALGAPTGPTQAGEVQLYRKLGGAWTLDGTLHGSELGGGFGSALDLEGDTLIVGSPDRMTGRAELFSHVTGSWTPAGTLSGMQPWDDFGAAVGVSGRHVVVGAPSYDAPGAINAGAVSTFDIEQDLAGSDGLFGQTTWGQLGLSVAISGDNLVVGHPGASEASGLQLGSGAGAACLQSWDPLGEDWGLDAPRWFTADAGSAGDGFGAAVASQNDWVVCGAPWESSAASAAGVAYRREVLVVGTHVEYDDPLPGANGLPSLHVEGNQCSSTTIQMFVENAPPASLGFLVLGLTAVSLPFKGGTLVPHPDVVVALPTGPTGSFALGLLYLGFPFVAQFWFPDPGGAAGFSSTGAWSFL